MSSKLGSLGSSRGADEALSSADEALSSSGEPFLRSSASAVCFRLPTFQHDIQLNWLSSVLPKHYYRTGNIFGSPKGPCCCHLVRALGTERPEGGKLRNQPAKSQESTFKSYRIKIINMNCYYIYICVLNFKYKPSSIKKECEKLLVQVLS